MSDAWSWGWYLSPLPSETIRNAVPILCTILLVVIENPLTTEFHRFLARFSGRRRQISATQSKFLLPLNSWRILLVVLISLSKLCDACSSRSVPKPRVGTTPAPIPEFHSTLAPTERPNITFLTYACNDNYNQFYCLNGATCFTVKIRDSILYNCICSTGYWGQRCEYKALQGSYNISHTLFETASIASGASIAILLAAIICVFAYQLYQRKAKRKSLMADTSALTSISKDCVDGLSSYRLNGREPIFSTRWKHVQQVHPRTEIRFPTRIRTFPKSRRVHPRKDSYAHQNILLETHLFHEDDMEHEHPSPTTRHTNEPNITPSNHQCLNNNTFSYINNNNSNSNHTDHDVEDRSAQITNSLRNQNQNRNQNQKVNS